MRRSLYLSLVGIILIAAAALGGTFAAGNSPALGLDLQGGVSVVLRPKQDVPSDRIDKAIDIIRQRVDAIGIGEPDISRQGDAIVVQIPGVKDPKQALELVGRTAELQFRPVLEALPVEDPTATTTTTAPGDTTTTTAAGETTTTVAGATTTAVPPTTAAGETTTSTTAPAAGATTSTTLQADDPTPDAPKAEDPADVPEKDENGKVVARYRTGPATVTGRHVKSAKATAPNVAEGWKVDLEFNKEGAKLFDEIAAANQGKQLAIVLDGVVQSAPVLQQAQFNGQAQISGENIDEKEAKELALVLRYGSLPVELRQETVQTVSPTLGRESLRAGLLAGLIGLGLVLLYIVLFYRALGVVVVLGLAVSASLLWSIISLLGATAGLTLSLAGATGIIVSVGVTVDSYVVYFERLKDEIRSGKTIRASVDRGFTRAFRTIVAADISSLIGAGLLYLLTVGSVRGFAFFLGLSTLLDLIVSYFFTRPMVIMLGRNRLFTEARWFGVARGLAAAPTGGASS